MPEVESSLRTASILALLVLTVISASPALAQKTDTVPYVVAAPEPEEKPAEPLGDRIQTPQSSQAALAALTGPSDWTSVRLLSDYRIGPGDVLTIRVKGRVDLHYGGESATNQLTAPPAPPDTYTVLPDGTVHLPLIGAVRAAGKTAAELQSLVTNQLAAYFRNFTVDLSVSRPRSIKVSVSGQVANPGPQVLAATATVLEALLRAQILPTGSTRLINLRRNGRVRNIDAYGIVSQGDIEGNAILESGDDIYVPAAVDCVTVTGEVCRPGRFEMVPPQGQTASTVRVSDLVKLSLGLLPTAGRSHAIIERPVPGGEVQAIHVDLSGTDDPELRPGDDLVVPSVADYQPTIRLVGEFKGEGVYQRVAGTVLNKSGVYRLAKGETAGDVIVRTGGTTPQADLKRAKIERRNGGKVQVIPLDLDRVLTYQDKSADVVLDSGDTVVLPALMDRVYVFGQVVRPGGMPYEPDRRLIDYLAGAGGPTGRAKTSIIVVRGDPEKSQIVRADIGRSIKGQERDNPVLQPGDVVYVPEKVVTDWRDLAQIISTVRLLTLF